MPAFLYNVLCAIDLIVAIFLIYIITIQESKNDGLQGQIGSTTTSAFKGKAGREEHLNLLTRNTSIVFFLLTLIIAMSAKH